MAAVGVGFFTISVCGAHMRKNRERFFAFASILFTPVVLMTVIAYRWRAGSCVGTVHESIWFFMIFAAYLATTINPYRAIAACLIYLPIGYFFTTEPCAAPRSQGAGGLIYLMSPIFILFILFGSIFGGWILRALVNMKRKLTVQPDESHQ